MEKRGLDQFVDHCAPLLISDDWRRVLRGTEMLKEAHLSGDEIHFSRQAQELAAYTRGGSVLIALLRRLLGQSTRSEEERDTSYLGFVDDKKALEVACTFAFVRLTNSRTVVNWCLRKEDIARKITAEFTFLVIKGVEDLGSKNAMESAWDPVWMQIQGLEGLFNFARCSKGYRELLKRLPTMARSFQAFESVLSREDLNLLGKDGLKCSSDAKSLLSGLVLVLASSTDSMFWAIDMGLLRIIAAIFESTQRCELVQNDCISGSKMQYSLDQPAGEPGFYEKAEGEERSVHLTISQRPNQLSAPRYTNLALHQGEATRSECGPVHGSGF